MYPDTIVDYSSPHHRDSKNLLEPLFGLHCRIVRQQPNGRPAIAKAAILLRRTDGEKWKTPQGAGPQNARP